MHDFLIRFFVQRTLKHKERKREREKKRRKKKEEEAGGKQEKGRYIHKCTYTGL